jgi:hypothetical protein
LPLRKRQTICFRSFAGRISEEKDRGLAVALLNGSHFPDWLYFVQKEHFGSGSVGVRSASYK